MTTNTTFKVTGLYKVREYRVLRDFDGHIATVDIPHQRRPSACLHLSKAALLEAAYGCSEKDSSWTFESFNVEKLTDCFGEGEEPAEAMKIAAEHGSVVLRNDQWIKPGEADEYEWALEFFGHDLYSFHVFESIGDAVVFAASYEGHGSGDANEALAEKLLRYDLIELVEDDVAE